MTRPPSPCKEICKLNINASVCTGCGRTLGEIAEWGARPPAVSMKSSGDLRPAWEVGLPI
ncbi:MAG: DUF1289 domain-containing protein [Sphingomonas sp.]